MCLFRWFRLTLDFFGLAQQMQQMHNRLCIIPEENWVEENWLKEFQPAMCRSYCNCPRKREVFLEISRKRNEAQQLRLSWVFTWRFKQAFRISESDVMAPDFCNVIYWLVNWPASESCTLDFRLLNFELRISDFGFQASDFKLWKSFNERALLNEVQHFMLSIDQFGRKFLSV